MTTTVETVDRRELLNRRRRLLARAHTTWADLQERATDYALADDERSIFDAIRSIDWMLARKS